MTTFGTTASKLAQDIADRERDLQLLADFDDNGGMHRIGISCDHPNEEVIAAIQRSFGKKRLNKILMEAILKVANAEVTAAKARLLSHVHQTEPHQPIGGAL